MTTITDTGSGGRGRPADGAQIFGFHGGSSLEASCERDNKGQSHNSGCVCENRSFS
jgi:hypothetical protein